MDYSTFCSQVAKKLNESEDELFRKADQKDIDYLKSSKYPDCIIEFYSQYEPQEEIEIDGVRLPTIMGLKDLNENAVPCCEFYELGLGYRGIAETYCGEHFLINVNNEQSIIYAALDVIEPDEDYTNDEIMSKLKKVTDSFDEFLEKFVKEKLPTGFYD
ncbi:MAG: hypothetical protein LBU83_11215 [Bacteroidales bacterium]|jgi:hypothetical protein|nr:hypothetical protein [Bacteroidales bacterium]